MKPKNKAEELIYRVMPLADYQECDIFTEKENMLKNSKDLAIIIVAEVTQENYKYNNNNRFDYWMEVVKEIKQYKD